MGRVTVVPGQVVASTHMNLAIDQGMMVFASAAARNTAIPTPTAGMHCFLTDTNRAEVYYGGAWRWSYGPVSRPAVLVDSGVGSQPSGTNTLKGGTATIQGGWSYSTVTGLHTVPEDGFYSMSAWFEVTSPSSGWVPLFYLQTGGIQLHGTTIIQQGFSMITSLAHIVYLAKNTTFSVQIIAYSAALTVNRSRIQAALV